MPLFGGRRRGAQTDTPEPGPDFEAGHEVLDLLGLGATAPYPDFVRRVHQDAAEWYGPDRGDLPAEAVGRSVRGLPSSTAGRSSWTGSGAPRPTCSPRRPPWCRT